MDPTASARPFAFSVDWSEYRRNWGWFLTLGVVLIVLGAIALVDAIAATVVSMLFFGWILIVAGILEAIQTFRHRRSGHLLLYWLEAVLSFVIGVMLLLHPVAGALILTLLLAAYFTVTGVFRIAAAISLRLPHWGWLLASGVITLLLGILVWAQWPISGLWVIGLFIGIDLILLGWSEVMFASVIRRLPMRTIP